MDRKIIRIMILCVCLLGCTSKLKNDNDIETGLQQLFPYMIIENDETGTYDGGYNYKRYTINNNGITFTYENYQSKDTLFGGTTTNSRNDYCTNLYEYFLDDINDISLKYNINVESSDNTIQISHSISDMNEIALGVQAAKDIYELFEDYIPQTTLNWFAFKITFTISYSGGKTITTINQQGDFDESYILNLTYMNFKDDVNQGLVSNVKISNELLDTIPQKYINSLYIDNKLYQSDQYETIFLYNVEDNQYYTIVSFGMDIDYNGGIEDYLQREIIETYYSESNYKITYNSKTSSYNIGNDCYSIERNDDGLIFMKNNKTIDIPNYSTISNTSSGASYYYWISVDDFASIMGMDVDKIEEDGVYLKTS